MTPPTRRPGSRFDRNASEAPGRRSNVDLPVDHALALYLQNDHEGALRWGAAALEGDPSMTSALLMTARLLEAVGRRGSAVEGLRFAVDQAVGTSDLPLALAAIEDLRTLGVEVDDDLDRLASVFCQGSPRLGDEDDTAPPSEELQPLSPILTGASLASRATHIVKAARTSVSFDEASRSVSPHPLFSALRAGALRELFASFERVDVAAGRPIVREDDEAAALYMVARGEVEISRRAAGDRRGGSTVIGRVEAGGFFGEAALLSNAPGETSVMATRPSILLFARRESLDAVVARHPEVAAALAAHGRRQSLLNLGWTSPLMVSLPAAERAFLAEHVETRVFRKGEKLVREGTEAPGLHLILSGDAALVVHDFGERLVLGTLRAGETVGEVELVLCCNARADCVARSPTTTLFLSRESFVRLVDQRPAILHALYALAVRTRGRMKAALAEERTKHLDDDEEADADLLVAGPLEYPHPQAGKTPPPRSTRTSIPPPIPRVTLPVMQPPRESAPRSSRSESSPPVPRASKAPPPPPSVPPMAASLPPPSRARASGSTEPPPPGRGPWFALLLAGTLLALLGGAALAVVLRTSAPAPTAASAPPVTETATGTAGTPPTTRPSAAAPPPAVMPAITVAGSAITSTKAPAPARPSAKKPVTTTLTAKSPAAEGRVPVPVPAPAEEATKEPAAAAPEAPSTLPTAPAAPLSPAGATADYGGRE